MGESNQFSKDVGKRLKDARKKSKIKQKDVAEILGIHNTTLARYESGVRHPDFETIEKLADLYNVTTNYLLTGDLPRGISPDQYVLDFDSDTLEIKEPDIYADMQHWKKSYGSAVAHINSILNKMTSNSLADVNQIDFETFIGLINFLNDNFKNRNFIIDLLQNAPKSTSDIQKIYNEYYGDIDNIDEDETTFL